jgi:hypothetical protein
VEISVKHDSGELPAITQAADAEFHVCVLSDMRVALTGRDSRSSFRKQNVTAD